MSCTRAETDGVIGPRRHGQADEAGQLVYRRRHHQEAKVLRGTRVFARLAFRRFPTTRMCIPLRFSRCCAIKTQNHVFVTDWSMRGSVVPDSMTSCQRAGVLLACVLLARTVCNRTDLGACPLPPLAARIPPYAGLDASIVDSRLPSRLSRCLARSPTLVTRLQHAPTWRSALLLALSRSPFSPGSSSLRPKRPSRPLRTPRQRRRPAPRLQRLAQRLRRKRRTRRRLLFPTRCSTR